MLKKKHIYIVIGLLLIVWIGSVVISKILVPEKNPPKRYTGIIIGHEADPILRRACFNCHSNETAWPWYTSLPIVSVLISSDVSGARNHLNFSNWESMPEDKRIFYLEMVLNEIELDEMPPLMYKLGHPEANLNQNDLKTLKNQAQSMGITFDPGNKSN